MTMWTSVVLSVLLAVASHTAASKYRPYSTSSIFQTNADKVFQSERLFSGVSEE